MNSLREFANWCPDVDPLDAESSERIWAEIVGPSQDTLEPETTSSARRPIGVRMNEPRGGGHSQRRAVAIAAAVLLVACVGAVAALQLREEPDPVTDQPATSNPTVPSVTEVGPSADSTESVVVANASDIGGIAGATTYRLHLEGFDVFDAVNAAASVGTIDESIVYARPGHEALRDELAARLGIDATALLEPDAPLPIDGTNIDHDQVAVLIMLGRGFTLAPDPDTITHAAFDDYLAQAREVFGDLSIGDSCEDWIGRLTAESAHLAIIPATNDDKGPCRVLGWTYNSGMTPDDVPADAIIVPDDGSSPEPIFDANGDVIAG